MFKNHSGCRVENGLKRHKRENCEGRRRRQQCGERTRQLDQTGCSGDGDGGLECILRVESIALGFDGRQKVKEWEETRRQEASARATK